MAHVLAPRRRMADQENGGAEQKRSVVRGKRSPSKVAPPVHSSASKRRALASITNHFTRERQPPLKPAPYVPKPGQLQTTLEDLLFPPPPPPPPPVSVPSSFYAETGGLHVPHISGEINLSSCSSSSAGGENVTNSFGLMNSFRSLGSPGSFDSPMLLSTPDSNKCTSLMCTEVIDIDVLEDSNCVSCGEYAKDIFSYLREAEVRFHPKPGYMAKQPDITYGMRSILVDWLVEVADEFKLEPQTLHLAISIADRFLSVMSVMRSKLQLVGTSSMFIAAKFEEIYPPEMTDFAYITDDTYSKAQIARMEMLILQALDFNLCAPTAHLFLERYLKAAEVEQLPSSSLMHSPDTLYQTIAALSKYLCELALQDADPYLKYFPSVIAASAVCLSRHTMGQTAWPSILHHYSGYTVSDIGHCLQDLHRSFSMAHRHPQQSIRQKYSSDRFMKVATLKAPETLPC